MAVYSCPYLPDEPGYMKIDALWEMRILSEDNIQDLVPQRRLDILSAALAGTVLSGVDKGPGKYGEYVRRLAEYPEKKITTAVAHLSNDEIINQLIRENFLWLSSYGNLCPKPGKSLPQLGERIGLTGPYPR